MEPGFSRGQSNNLPKVDHMVADFFTNHAKYISAEIQGQKLANLFISSYYLTLSVVISDENVNRKIPDGLLFGAASSAYQIEGAWDVDGKTESILDYLTHNKSERIKDRSTGDIAANSYYLYKRDVQMMKELGLDFYRFSLSWSRILPYNSPNKINPKGVEYYNNLIDEMLKYNIQPVITLYHWDLPLEYFPLGGWTNPQIVEWFSDYARTAFKLFGDRVKYWITLNEPYNYCSTPYGANVYQCVKNSLLAHATAYHIYDEEFRNSQQGIVFISLSAEFYAPKSADDVEATQLANDFYWGIFAQPIYSEHGDFPESVKKRVAEKSAAQGYATSKLPELTPEEIEYIKGTSDVFGLNHYSTHLVYTNESQNKYEVSSLLDDLGVQLYHLPSWKIGASDYTYWAPRGFYNILTVIREKYNNPPIFISENGFATHGGLEDQDRVTYYKSYISAMLDAIDEGSDIRAYTAWSLLDNFEWYHGYTERFGLYEVDFSSEERTRTPRASALMYQELLRTRTLNFDCDLRYNVSILVDSINYN